MEKISGLPLDCGVAGQALSGQHETGDKHVIVPLCDGLLVSVVDGLGHGLNAATAARIAVETLQLNADQPVIRLVQMCHEKLRPTRGVVMSIATFDVVAGTVTWIGIGNVEGVLLRRDLYGTVSQERLSLRGGVVGDQLPNLVASIIPVRLGDTLIFATDGLRNDFLDGTLLVESAQQMAENILARHARGTDDALVLVVRYCGTQRGSIRGWVTN